MLATVLVLAGIASAAAPPANCRPVNPRKAAVERASSGSPYPARAFDAEIVTIECDDGYRLAADFIRRKRQSAKLPAVILLHDAGGSRGRWFPIALHLAGRGCAVLAVDLRGYGESPAQVGNPPPPAVGAPAPDGRLLLADLRNVVSFVAMKNDVDGGRIALVGAGLGGDLALAAAGESWSDAVRCVVAVSPALEDRGLDTAAAAARIGKGRSLFLAAAKGDAPGAAAVARLASLHAGPKDVFLAEGDQRGLELLSAGLIRKVPDWVLSSLGGAK